MAIHFSISIHEGEMNFRIDSNILQWHFKCAFWQNKMFIATLFRYDNGMLLNWIKNCLRANAFSLFGYFFGAMPLILHLVTMATIAVKIATTRFALKISWKTTAFFQILHNKWQQKFLDAFFHHVGFHGNA